MKSLSYTLVGFLAVVLATGCPGSGKATVKGKVTYKGKAVTGGMLTFATADGKSASAQIKGDGTYLVTDVPMGSVKATVTPMISGMMAPTSAPKGTPVIPTASDEPKFMPLPAKFGKADTSGLSYTVSKKDDTIDVTLAD